MQDQRKEDEKIFDQVDEVVCLRNMFSRAARYEIDDGNRVN